MCCSIYLHSLTAPKITRCWNKNESYLKFLMLNKYWDKNLIFISLLEFISGNMILIPKFDVSSKTHSKRIRNSPLKLVNSCYATCSIYEIRGTANDDD